MLERRQLLRDLAAVPTLAAEAARAAPPPEPREWSARQIVCHLVAVESAVWHDRLDLLWERDDEPAWSWTEPGPWAGPGSATLESALRAFEVRRAATLDRLAGLDDAGWGRVGIHATYGRMDVAALMRLALDHDREHLASLRRKAS